jgi:hypothetical protein
MSGCSWRLALILAIAFLPATDRSWSPGPGTVLAQARTSFNQDDYAHTLKSFVDDRGMVDYAGLKMDRGRLDSFLEEAARLDTATYRRWSDPEKIAFWINVYNGQTLKAIIDHYPIKPRFGTSLLYPKNSIRQIAGVWDKLQFTVQGATFTLNGIEHDTLRPGFDEPRIHLALVCAAMGCPPLRNEPFDGRRLDEQLDDQANRFLNDPQKFRIDRSQDKVYLSSILKWYGADFVKSFGTEGQFGRHSAVEKAVLNFKSGYLNQSDRDYLKSGDFAIEYIDYDWTLNQQ